MTGFFMPSAMYAGGTVKRNSEADRSGPELVQVLAALERREHFERDGRFADARTLGPVRTLLAAWGDPQESFEAIHVAGTEGKGSVASFAADILASGGTDRPTGLYTSPHLVRLNERIRVDGREIEDGLLADALDASMEAAPDEATWFDVVTAAAFHHFRASEVGCAVVEAGLGGRLDSTSVVQSTATVITRIGLDHAEVLGSSEFERATEKAGIVQQGVPCVSGVAPDGDAGRVVEEACRRAAVPLWRLGSEVDVHGLERTSEGFRMDVTWPGGGADGLGVDGPARFQVGNLALAAAAVAATGRDVADGTRVSAVEGRLQPLPGYPRVFVDGGHTAAAVEAALTSVREVWGRPVAVLGCLADKDAAGMLRKAAAHASEIVVCSTPSRRGLDARALAHLAESQGIAVRRRSDPAAALRLGQSLGEPVVASGSMVLAGAVLSECGLT